MMSFTRWKKEQLVLDLYNQGKTAKEIAKTVHMSFRDIGTIIREQEEKRGIKEVQVQQQYLSSEAYRLFSKGKTPVQVAIELNLRQPEATALYAEYCKLTNLGNLYQIYDDLKGDVESFVELYRLIRAAGMNSEHVNKLLTFANHHLPSLQSRYGDLKRQVSSMEGQMHYSTIIFQELSDHISNLYKTSDSVRLECQKEKEELASLQQKRMKQEALVRQFENDNEAYNNIRKAAEEKVVDTLANRKELLRLAIFCVIESIREDPDKYGPLVYYNEDSNNAFCIPQATPISPIAAYYNRSSYTYSEAQQEQRYYLTKDSLKQGYIDMLKEESEKLFASLEKMLVDEAVGQYVSKTPSSSLPMLPPEQHQKESERNK